MLNDVAAFFTVAVLAEKLKVPGAVAPTFRYRNDVIKLQLLLLPTSHTSSSVALPDEHLCVLRNGFSLRRTASRAFVQPRGGSLQFLLHLCGSVQREHLDLLRSQA